MNNNDVKVYKMTFLDKLNFLMKEHNLNKSTLSKSCGIPYTTIDGWYKKGFDDLRLSTLKKLSSYFNTSLDFWVIDDDEISKLSDDELDNQIIKVFNRLSEEKQKQALDYLAFLASQE